MFGKIKIRKPQQGFQKGHRDFRTPEGIQRAAQKMSIRLKGKKFSRKWRKHLSESHLGQKPWNKCVKGIFLEGRSPFWKGDMVGYTALHDWVKSRLGTPSKCSHCGTITAKRFE